MKTYNEKNPFTLGQVLSVTHGRLMSDISGVYTIMNHMTGQSLMTHQLPLAGRACKPVLVAKYPEVAAADLGHVTKDNWREVLVELIAIHGDSFDVPVLETWDYSDPIQSLVDMVGEEKVMVVTV